MVEAVEGDARDGHKAFEIASYARKNRGNGGAEIRFGHAAIVTGSLRRAVAPGVTGRTVATHPPADPARTGADHVAHAGCTVAELPQQPDQRILRSLEGFTV
jgi:hypothetical protein